MKKIRPLPEVVRETFARYGRKLKDTEILSVQFDIFRETDCVVSEDDLKRWNESYWDVVNAGMPEREGAA